MGAILTLWGRPDWMPVGDSNIREWWGSISVPHEVQKDFGTAVTLVFWSIWRHQNDVVFSGTSPSCWCILNHVLQEAVRWEQTHLCTRNFVLSGLRTSGLLVVV
ncbi:hypothetical protein BRADI_4g05445v3 [Brachypodium distachyon]|uniref:Reverse transcriptase zinc-binding domain-containing protein n=1 Tax=Brachypodium distachyon TaxID=15368 RepID=A0A2K2CKL3_BRADI|nr:hypothetical protein BRADI_4g05445v3 [Brachypodium distachyon]